ncbi:MAG: class I SAM-dependent methyltransferase, partial [Tetrasphaera sp.]|nr:class I SAM-dependent methyltransferase [Tetrasphaera sp.]
MPTRPDAAAKAAVALYADAPRADRVHVRGRWWTAPFTAVEKSLPTTGRVLEVGCGHGLFVAYAALTGPQRTVVGVDIDTDKIAVGTRALAPLGERAT